MNLNQLFPAQAELDKRIIEEHNLQGVDLVKKKSVALICELYETVNEARFFKFWSYDQRPRTIEINRDGETANEYYKNPLLEEYVDTIHFALSIANDLNYKEHTYNDPGNYDLNDLTIGLTNLITLIPEARYQRHISSVLNLLIKLGYQLGFDEKTVIDAYFAKNKINFERQEVGY